MATCASCGFENPEGARFCNQCGSPLAAAAPATGERRQITVVFSDLSGFTALSERLDPEDVQAVMSDIFTEATRIITRYGGKVDKLIGDAVMAVFGDPVVHEDDAERAIRATMEIHRAVDDLSPRLEGRIGRPLVMHSGVNTGVAVTSGGSMDTADTGPLGDTINIASRLEDLSRPGEILLGPTTAALVDGVFELADHGSHDLKGKTGSLAVSRVVGVKSERTGPSRRQGAFVGRHEELGILLGAVERVQDGVGSVIGVRAEAGTGKTRLLAEFHQRVADKVQWLEGRAYAYGENIPFAALVDLVSNTLGINEDDTQGSIATKLRDGIAGLVENTDRILDPFHRLYGLDVREGAGLDKETFRDRLFESVSAVIQGLAGRAPTVLVFQDLHWADPSTVGILGALAGSMRAPIVIVANYRPEFAAQIPGVREIELQALSTRQTGELVGSLLATDDPPRQLVDFVTARTDGNPFYLEEIINSLIETGTLAKANGTWEIRGSVEEADVPNSVRGVIAARIDRLEAGRRRVLREASVVGRDFLYDVIRKVATVTDELDPSLSDLETADLIRERADQSDLEYFFKHALTQDVAYEGLLRQERTTLHARAAMAIEQQFAGRLEEVTETLAFHFAEGAVVDKAVHYLRRAGLKAMDRYALVEAQAHFDRAYAMLTEAGESAEVDRALVETILDWSILFYYRARLPELDELMDRHEAVMDRLDDDRLLMWWLIWRGHARGFLLDHRDVLGYLDPALELARARGDDVGLAYVETWRSWAYLVRGDTAQAVEVAEPMIPYLTEHRASDPYPYLKTLGMLALAYSYLGRHTECDVVCAEMIEFGVQAGNTRCEAMGHQMRSLNMLAGLSYEDAVVEGAKAVEVAIDPVYRESARMSLAMIAATAGDQGVLEEAQDGLQKAIGGGVSLVMPLLVDLSHALVDLSGTDPVGALERLLDLAGKAEHYERGVERMFADLFVAVIFARMTTGEVKGDWRTIVRSPRALKYVRMARREARPRLERLVDRLAGDGFPGLVSIARYELVKLLLDGGDAAEARRHLLAARQQVAALGETEGSRRIDALLDGS